MDVFDSLLATDTGTGTGTVTVGATVAVMGGLLRTACFETIGFEVEVVADGIIFDFFKSIVLFFTSISFSLSPSSSSSSSSSSLSTSSFLTSDFLLFATSSTFSFSFSFSMMLFVIVFTSGIFTVLALDLYFGSHFFSAWSSSASNSSSSNPAYETATKINNRYRIEKHRGTK